ncbi:uncharacterized protein [Asterias amurensis]|uniref:uncharacterized protein n=1 Tax=Asterias amurensis TaxID=7602 RepID=UPI003AB17F8F
MSASMWNRCEVSPPPIASCSYDCYEVEEDDVGRLKTALQALQVSYSVGIRLSSEEYTLNRLLYKVNNQQRQWRWHQMMKKIQKCLIKLQSTLPVKFIEDAVCCCQITHDERSSTIRLPSRQMLEYILIKLMGQAKLCVYILNMAESVYVFAVQNITCGQFLGQNMIYSSIVSRVWVMMRSMLKDMTSWYSHLLPWMDKLKATLMQWMTTEDAFPPSLLLWLKPDYDPARYDIKQPSKKKPSTLLDSMFADQADGKALKNETEEKEHSLEESLTTKEPVLDLGEPVALDEVAQKRSKVKLKRKRSESRIVGEPATNLSRLEEETIAVDANGMYPPRVQLEDDADERSAETEQTLSYKYEDTRDAHPKKKRKRFEKRENETTIVEEDETSVPVGKRLKKLLTHGLKKKLKETLRKKKRETAVTEQMVDCESEDMGDAHSKKKRKRFENLRDKFRLTKKKKNREGLSQDVKQTERQANKESVKQQNHQKLVLEKLKKKSKGLISKEVQELDSSPSRTVNAQWGGISQDAPPGGSGVLEKGYKTKKVKASTLVCELDKISETKSLTSRTSDIDDIFACLE